jgi:outer membrane protein TolC
MTRRDAAGALSGVSWIGCALGPDYRKPTIDIPTSFKEGVDWQWANANPHASLSNTWWLDYNDTLTDGHAQMGNQSIARVEAAYRLAQVAVPAIKASFVPTIGADDSGSPSGPGAEATGETTHTARRAKLLRHHAHR